MHERSKKIFQYILQERKPVELQELAEYFQVSIRTVYNDITKVDEFLTKNHFPVLQKMKGTVAYGVSKDIENQLIQELMKVDQDEGIYDPAIRRQSIIKYLINQPDYSTIEEAANRFQVSRNTITNDFKEMRPWLKKHNLMLQTVAYKGVKIKGTEKSMRNALLELMRNDYSLIKWENGSDQEKVHNIIGMIEEQMKTSFTDYFHYQLNLYLYVAIIRIQSGFVVEQADHEEIKYLTQTKEFRVVSKAAVEIQRDFAIMFSENEVFYFTRKIMESSLIEDSGEGIYEKWLPIHLLTNALIKGVGASLKLDFSGDQQLFRGLIHHLRPAYYRMMNHVRIENPLKEEIIQKYPAINNAVSQNKARLETELKVRFDAAETAFITMFFAAAYERMIKHKGRIPTAVLVCHSGISTSQMLLSQIKSMFKVNIVGIYSVRKLQQELGLISADFIISTVQLDLQFDKIIIVNPVLSHQDKIKLKTLFDELEINADVQQVIDIFQKHGRIIDEPMLRAELDQYFHGIEVQKTKTMRSEPMLIEVFNESMISVKQEVKSREEAVQKSGEILLQNNLIEESYVQGMLDNLKENGSYFVIAPGIAMPHARPECGVKQIGFSLMTLKEPVVFGHASNDPVNIVIGLCAVDHQTHLMALAELIEILSNQENLNKITMSESAAEIMKIIKGGQ